jgi:hypothetical protein
MARKANMQLKILASDISYSFQAKYSLLAKKSARQSKRWPWIRLAWRADQEAESGIKRTNRVPLAVNNRGEAKGHNFYISVDLFSCGKE